MDRLLRVELPDARAPGGHVHATVVGSDRALLVDPGHRTDDLDAALADRSIAHVALTHHHRDHADALSHYASEHDATVWCRAGHVTDFEHATGVTPDRTFREGTPIETDAYPVTVVETPGHAPEHVAFSLHARNVTDPGDSDAADGDGGDGYDGDGEGGDGYDDGGGHGHGASDDVWVAGDLAFQVGSVAIVPPNGDLRAYLTSLRRLHARAPERLLPGHGPVVDDPRATAARLVAHRADRERSVLAAIEEGAQTVPDITDRAYDKDVSDVRRMAEGTVRAHLEKLAVEGRIRWEDDRVTTA